jgi:hypothetical protein
MNVTIQKLNGLWHLIVGSCQINAELQKVLMVTKGADDMSDHDEWISYSHWGMFTLERKSSRQSN